MCNSIKSTTIPYEVRNWFQDRLELAACYFDYRISEENDFQLLELLDYCFGEMAFRIFRANINPSWTKWRNVIYWWMISRNYGNRNLALLHRYKIESTKNK